MELWPIDDRGVFRTFVRQRHRTHHLRKIVAHTGCVCFLHGNDEKVCTKLSRLLSTRVHLETNRVLCGSLRPPWCAFRNLTLRTQRKTTECTESLLENDKNRRRTK